MASNEIEIEEILDVIYRRKKVVIFIVSLVTFASIIISLFLPKYYKSEAVILPLGSATNSSGGMAAIVSAQLGISGGGGGEVQILAILKSNSLAEFVINKLNLIPAFYPKLWNADKKAWNVDEEKIPTMEDAVDHLKSIVAISDDPKKKMINISALTRDPKLSADLVNTFVLGLQDSIQRKAYTSAKRYRLYLERQVEEKQTELLELEKEIFSFYAMNNISSETPTLNVDASISNGKKDFNPFPDEEFPIDKEIAFYQGQLDMLAGKSKSSFTVEQVPQQAYMMYLLAKQKIMEQLVYLVTQRYEVAKMDEVREDINFQVIDWGKIPIKRDKPKRKLIVIFSFLASAFFAVMYIFIVEYFSRNKKRV